MQPLTRVAETPWRSEKPSQLSRGECRSTRLRVRTNLSSRRKGILLITVFPVISGLTIINVAAFDAGFEATRSLILGLITGTTLIVLMTFSYLNAKRAERSVPYLQ